MDQSYLHEEYSYVMLCTECEMPFPPFVFDGQAAEFRMCTDCQRRNPEIMHYLNRYIYGPQRVRIWRPFQERVDGIVQQLGTLESDLELYKNVPSVDIVTHELDRHVGHTLDDLIMEVESL